MSPRYSSEKSQKKAQKKSKVKHLPSCNETDYNIKGDLDNLEVVLKNADKERKASIKMMKKKKKKKRKKVLGIESCWSDGVIEMTHSTKGKNPNKISRNELNSKCCEVGSVSLHSIESTSMEAANRKPETSVQKHAIFEKNEVTSCLDARFLKHKKQKKCMSCDVFRGVEGDGDTVSPLVESEGSSNGMLEEQRAAEDGSCRTVMKGNADTSTDQLIEFRTYNTNDQGFWVKMCWELRSKGKKFNSGRFSVEEDQQLRKNWKRITKNCPFEPPQVLLFRYIYRDKRKHVLRHIKDTNFYIRLGKHINRPPSASYYRARKLFHPAQLRSRFSPEENTFLLKMFHQYGAHWMKIGHLMDRREDLLAGHFKIIKSNYNRGPWTEEEDQQLIAAVKSKVHDCDDSKAFVNFPWTEIAKMVPTRYSVQCRMRWIQVLAFGQTGKQRFSMRHKKKLIREIKNQKVNHECDIDWIDLTSKFNVASPQFLQNRFRSLRSMMPSYQLHSLEDILDYIEKWLLSHKRSRSKGHYVFDANVIIA